MTVNTNPKQAVQKNHPKSWHAKRKMRFRDNEQFNPQVRTRSPELYEYRNDITGITIQLIFV